MMGVGNGRDIVIYVDGGGGRRGLGRGVVSVFVALGGWERRRRVSDCLDWEGRVWGLVWWCDLGFLLGGWVGGFDLGQELIRYFSLGK